MQIGAGVLLNRCFLSLLWLCLSNKVSVCHRPETYLSAKVLCFLPLHHIGFRNAACQCVLGTDGSFTVRKGVSAEIFFDGAQ